MRWPDLRLTVDEPADYELVRRTFETLHAENGKGRTVIQPLLSRAPPALQPAERIAPVAAL
ncbi:hypothetical protein [Azospirillum argentinense]|uniref:hypothetical protein n=1 Tax=Azospirillum argentinense TaxID=2970906 RepID=UPI0010C1231C|nr:hypothetical protein [Azospirillum argentinense]